jgi:ComF family protein
MTISRLRHWLSFLQPRCVLCDFNLARSPSELCPSCRAILPQLQHACACCAEPMLEIDGRLCGRCLNRRPRCDQIRAVWLYAAPIDQALQRLKFSADFSLLPWLVESLRSHVPDDSSAITFVPQSAESRRERGFNQAELLARELAKQLKAPLFTGVEKVRHTERQANLSYAARARNLRGAFRADAAPERLLLIDDVVTTGRTVNTVAHVLKQAGARRVHCLALARAPRSQSMQRSADPSTPA